MRYTYRYRSFFWPAILILGGVVALLVNTGQIPVDRLYQLVNLWPVVLVVIGLELIIRRTVHGLTGDVAAALIVLIAVVGAAAYVTVGPNPSATHTFDAATPAGDLTEATLEIDAGASTVTLSGSTGVGADLYRAHLEYTGPTPTVNHDSSRGTVRINQRSNNFGILQPLHFKANVQLNPGVAWAIRLNSGATTTTINVAHVHVTSVTLNSGAGRDDITLGPASGLVPVEINGGALTVHLHRPSETEATIEVSGGAVSLDADGRSMHAIGHLTYTSSGFSGAANGYRIKVNGGACTVTLDTTTESGQARFSRASF